MSTEKTKKTKKTKQADPVLETLADAPAGTPTRIAVRKTYKLFIGGAFPRSESGRTFVVKTTDGAHLANAAAASRKDLRDAVRAARAAQPDWARATAYLRGQITYRIAEMVEARRDQFAQLLTALGDPQPLPQIDAAIDRLVWYAGWPDKLTQVFGSTNQVAGPYLNMTTAEPTGVVGAYARAQAPLLDLVNVIAPIIVSGNTCVSVSSEPLTAITFAEALATSDLPAGVVNVLTGQISELGPWLAAHLDVNALDLADLSDPADARLATALEAAAATNLKRVLRPGEADGLGRLRAYLEAKTLWHPISF